MKAYYIPNGVKNIAGLFPLLDFNGVAKYKVHVADIGFNQIATSPVNQIAGVCCEDKIRIHYLNYLGTIDAINFKRVLTEHEVTSDTSRRSLTQPLDKTVHGINRFNVKANDTLTLSNSDYPEEDQDWLQEIVDSPLTWIEVEGIQGQEDGYIPVFVLDNKHIKHKFEERYQYEFILQIKLSHEKFIIRN